VADRALPPVNGATISKVREKRVSEVGSAAVVEDNGENALCELATHDTSVCYEGDSCYESGELVFAR